MKIRVDKSEDLAILVVQTDEVNVQSRMLVSIKKPQVIHMYTYDLHLLFSKVNIETLIYYVQRFKIDFLCLNIPLTKYIKVAKTLINRMKQDKCNTRVVCTGDAITPQISGDIGADGYTYTGDDLVRVIDAILYEERKTQAAALSSFDHEGIDVS